MNPSRPAIALCLTLTLVLAGCTSPGGPSAETAGELNLAPGSTASVPLTFESINATPEDAQLAVSDAGGLEAEIPATPLAGDNGTLNGWLTVTVAEDASPGDHQVIVALTAGDETKRAQVDVSITQPNETLAQGEIAQLHLTARTPDGKVAFTTDSNVSDSPFPTTESFQPPRRPGPTQVPLQERAQLPGDLLENLVGAGIGQDLSVEVPDAFGPETLQQNQSREETIQRTMERQRVTEVPRQLAMQRQLINESTEEGDTLDLPGTELPYVVDHLNETQVRLVLDAQENQTYTIYEAWPDAAQVTQVNNTTVTLYVTPAVDEGETFTWNPQWPNATEIVTMTDDEIVLRHSPEPGTTYTQTNRRGQATELTVAELTEDNIVVERDNPHPLAGQTMTFEIRVEGHQQAPQGGMGQPGQPSPR